MLLHPSAILLLLVSALGALAALGDNIAYKALPTDVPAPFAGGWWFQEIDASAAATMSDADVQAAAKNGYLKAKAKAPAVKPSGVKAPPIVVALFLPNKGVVLASSIKTGAPAQSTQTCATITWQHRNYANCGEPNALSITVQEGWITSSANSAIPAGAKMAIYGKPGKTEGFQKPCADGHERGDGCEKFLSEHPNISLVNPAGSKRSVEFVA